MIQRDYLVLLSMLIRIRHQSDLVRVEGSGIRNMLDRKIVYEVYVHPPFINGNYFSKPAFFRYSLNRGSEWILSMNGSTLSWNIVESRSW